MRDTTAGPMLSFRQGDEFFLVARHNVETPGLPLVLGLLDALLRGRHEIPPDITLGAERSSTEQHHMCAMLAADDDLVARTEHQQPVRREAVARDFHIAVQYIDR